MSSPTSISSIAGVGEAAGGAESTRRLLTARQAATVERLTDAAVDQIRAHGYDGLTVRNVARAAGVAAATAYQYFASKDHLVTELFWRRLAALDETPHTTRQPPASRVEATLADLALLVADEPRLGAACSVAMLGSDPEVHVLRDRIGLEMHRRLASALGAQADPAALRVLELALTGALVQAGMGHMSYDDLPARLAEVSRLVLGRLA